MKRDGEYGVGAGRDARAARMNGSPVTPVFGAVPSVVIYLSVVFAITFAILRFSPPAVEAAAADMFGLAPDRLFDLNGSGAAIAAAILPVFSHVFIHATFPHLIFNLMWLVVFGTPVALRFGSAVRFLAFFFACAAAGGVFFSFFHMEDSTVLVGASGGITGLLGGLVRFAFHRPLSKPASAKGVLPLTDRSVLTWSAVVILMNASVAVFGPGLGAGDADIAWQAHIGGYLFGLLSFKLFDPAQR